ncbi:NAD(P)-dependent oxidoreductase [Aquamicrobium terrae]|uniref:Phosphoglycerate dehydrogenase-like enzyme n=1 Tax=Aquamicrobium terrae TaxID=1324945 RepID=A0ABV2MX72_9HYPH
MKALFLTNRAPRHQKIAMQAAPDFLDMTMLEAPSRDSILANIADAEVLITERSGVIDAGIVEAGRKLRLVQRLGRFTHDIDVAAVERAGAALCFSPLLVSTLVSEHVVMQVLALAKTYREAAHAMLQPGDWPQPRKCDENYFAYNWTGRTGMRTLADSTVGIVGLGEIGADVARRLQGFGCEVLYYKRNRLPEAVEAELGIAYADLDAIRARSDFLCLLTPHSPGAGESIDRAYIDRMKPGAFLVSTGASTVLKEADVAEAVLDGRLAGVASDGFVYEPAPLDSPLLSLAREHPQANVILSPHIAGGVASNDVAARAREFENIRRLKDGRPLLYRLV